MPPFDIANIISYFIVNVIIYTVRYAIIIGNQKEIGDEKL